MYLSRGLRDSRFETHDIIITTSGELTTLCIKMDIKGNRYLTLVGIGTAASITFQMGYLRIFDSGHLYGEYVLHLSCEHGIGLITYF